MFLLRISVKIFEIWDKKMFSQFYR